MHIKELLELTLSKEQNQNVESSVLTINRDDNNIPISMGSNPICYIDKNTDKTIITNVTASLRMLYRSPNFILNTVKDFYQKQKNLDINTIVYLLCEEVVIPNGKEAYIKTIIMADTDYERLDIERSNEIFATLQWYEDKFNILDISTYEEQRKKLLGV